MGPLGQTDRHVIAMLPNDFFFIDLAGAGVEGAKRKLVHYQEGAGYSLEKRARCFSGGWRWSAIASGQSRLHLQNAESELGRCIWKSAVGMAGGPQGDM